MRAILIVCLMFVASCLPLSSLPQRGETEIPAFASAQSSPGPKMKVYIPYVGQGDATLIQTPNGKHLLIDAGPPAAGNTALLPLLRELHIDTLDALLITHYDLDHLGGVPSLLKGEDGILGSPDDIPVKVAYDRGGNPLENSPGFGDYLGALDGAKISRQSLAAGDRISLDDALDILCLAANGIVQAPGQSSAQIDLGIPAYSGKENAASIVVKIDYGNFQYLTGGDLTGGGMTDGFLTPDVESLLADSLSEVDVLHVNHHGSLSSSNPSLVAATSPQAVVIQAGKDNPYGHPHHEVLRRWQEAGAAIHSTVEGSGFILETNGDGFEIQPIGN